MLRLACAVLLVGCVAEMAPPGDESGSGTDEVPVAGVLPPSTASVDEVVAWLAAELPARSPGTELSITFEDLQTGQRAVLSGDTKHVSASSAKAWWVAAALDGAGLAAVAPYANAIFTNSDNSASGSVIDLIGPNAVNTWMWNVAGMNDSALTHWNYDKTRVATNSPLALGDDNYMTSDDAVRFLGRVYRKEILADERGEQLLEWLTLSPNSGTGGWLLARLPAEVQDLGMHKGGWLPPGCCSDDGYYNTANEIGIVTTRFGRAYAVSILARRGTDYWNRQVPFVELASCVMYRAFVQDDTLVCE
ncbi:MAG TPA: serine hydrolase [Kofleriaceae bacterium]|nr:serine hydrolase [Kofleriaceae bacterium]